MKRLIITIAALLATTSVLADTYVRGYTRSNGTYVAPHHRSDADGNPHNNFSTYGNTNPYTGASGYKHPESTIYNPRSR